MRIDKRFILLNIPYLLFFWIADKICYIYRITEGNKIIALVQGIAEFYKAPLFSFHIIDISIGVIAALLIKCAVYVRGKNAKKYRNGIEYGSARWGPLVFAIRVLTSFKISFSLRMYSNGLYFILFLKFIVLNVFMIYPPFCNSFPHSIKTVPFGSVTT